MTTLEFLNILQQRELAPDTVLDSLREEALNDEHRVTPQSVLKRLVQQEVISKPEAKQLLTTTLTVSSSDEANILGIEWTPPSESIEDSQASSLSLDDIPTLTPIDSESAIEDLREPAAPLNPPSTEEHDFLFEAPPTPAQKSKSAPQTFSVDEVTEEKQESKKKKRKKKQSEWDSPLLLVGGAGLAVLLLCGAVVYYLLNRENADAVLKDARDFYDSGSYTQAIKQYERFIERFPNHPEHSTAKIQLGMTRLWNATQGTSQFPAALTTAQQVLDDLKNEPAFRDAQEDLAALLPDIAQGLATQAEKSNSTEEAMSLIEQTEAALALCANTKYIPEQYRDEIKLAAIERTLYQVRRSQEQQGLLKIALTNIQSAIDNQQIGEAYQVLHTLLHDAPGLKDSEEITSKLREISAAEQSVVKYVEKLQNAETEERPTPIVASLTLADRSGPAIENGSNSIVCISADGNLYALDFSDGSVLWHRHVGVAPNLSPITLADGDILVIDSVQNELLRLQGSSGALVWRHPFENSIVSPTINGKQTLVPESSGKLFILDLDTGNSSGYVQFGQPIVLPVTLSSDGNHLYIVGEHSSLFTLSNKDLSCLGVHYLGHAKGSIATPLISILNKVAVVVNQGIETSSLHLLNTDAEGNLTDIAATQRLTGLVTTSMFTSGRRLAILTSAGQVTINEVNDDNGSGALTPLATREADGDWLLARYGLLHESRIWSAGDQLNKMAILPTGNRLPMQNIDNSYLGDIFDHPLQAVNGHIVHVRRPVNSAGVIVAAMNLETGKAMWETHLAMPPAGAPALDLKSTKISAITSSGVAYQFDRESLRKRVQNQADKLPSQSQVKLPLSNCVDLGQGRVVAGSPGLDALVLYDPNKQTPRTSILKLDSPLSGSLVSWDNQFVVPTSLGQVFLIDSAEGKQVGAPFQPPLTPEDKFNWLAPAVYRSGNESKLVISDGANKIYLVSKASSPQPHLKLEAESPVGSSELNTPLSVFGETVFAGTKTGLIARFQLPSLSALDPVELNAQIIWGPHTVDNHLICATDTNELIYLDQEANTVWKQPLLHQQPIGQPLAIEDSLYIAWNSGFLSKLIIASGEETGSIELKRPLAAGPIALGKRFVLPSQDGPLIVVNRP